MTQFSIKKNFLLIYAVLFALLTLGSLYGNSYAEPLSSEDVLIANLGFGKVVSDDEILSSFGQYNVTPRAAYMWTNGLAGTHRSDEAQDLKTFLNEARNKTIEMFMEGLKSNNLRLKKFLKFYKEKEIVRSKDLQTEIRSLLNIRASLKSALAATKSGDPLIFSIEISGDPIHVENMSGEMLVKAFQKAETVDGKIMIPHTPKPEIYQEEFTDPEIQSMNGEQLYQQLKAQAVEFQRKSPCSCKTIPQLVSN
jgi:hypothetical protein